MIALVTMLSWLCFELCRNRQCYRRSIASSRHYWRKSTPSMLQAIGLSPVTSSMTVSETTCPNSSLFPCLPSWHHWLESLWASAWPLVALEVPDHCIQRPVSCWEGLDAIPCHLLHSHECLTVSPQQLSNCWRIETRRWCLAK